jgi:hypothetical protein
MPKVQISIKELQKRKLFIATPMYGGNCAGPFTKSCLDLNSLCGQYGIQAQFFFLFNESLITRARNYLADEFLRSEATHLMFIDSDIDFDAKDVLTLLALDKPIIGGPYSKKTIAWEKVFDAVHLGAVTPADNPLKLVEYSADYVFNVPPGTKEIQIDEPAQVLELGTGFMMVRRDVFEQFAKAYPDYAYKPDHNRTLHFDGSRKIHMYFQALIDPESERYLSEDYMFCQWCRKIGIEIWLCPWMRLKHIGTHIFGGSMHAIADLSHRQQNQNFATPVARSADEKVQR